MFRFRQIVLVATSYTALAITAGWRLRAGDEPQDPVDKTAEATLTEIATRIAGAPGSLRQAAISQLPLLTGVETDALHKWAQEAPEQRMRRLTVLQGPVHAPGALNAALLFSEIDRADAPPIDDTRLLISASGDRVTETHKIEVLRRLATKATDNNEHDLALEIRQRISEFPSAAWQDVLLLADAARLARRPAAALRVLKAWLDPAAARLDSARREDALDLQTSLLLEEGRHAEASRIALDDLRSLKPSDAAPPRLLQRAWLAARAAGESTEMLPWIERHLRTFPTHTLATIEEISTRKTIPADYLRWLDASATIADGNHQGSIACDGFFRLAAAGQIHVLARLHTLAGPMGRGAEFTRLIAILERRFSVIEICQALATGGAPSPARDFLAAHLKTTPDHRAGWWLLTELDIRLRGDGSAPMLWEGFLKRFPNDVPALRQLACLHMGAAQNSQALKALRRIPTGQLDESDLRRIAALASQLDDIPALHYARQLLVQASANPAVSDIIALASLTRQNPDTTSEAVLAAALSKLPVGSAFRKASLQPSAVSAAAAFSAAVRAE